MPERVRGLTVAIQIDENGIVQVDEDYVGVQPPLFIFGQLATSCAASSSAAGCDPADVLQPEELNGWRPSGTSGDYLELSATAPALDSMALTGAGFAGVTATLSGSNDAFATSTDLGSVALTGNAGYLRFTGAFATYRVNFAGYGTAFKVKHALLGSCPILPFLEDGVGLNPLQAEATDLISQQGLYLGTVQTRSMRVFSLPAGQVTDEESTLFDAWASICIKARQPFFFVPDVGGRTCYFGWVDAKYKYDPVRANGMANIGKIPFNCRA